MASAVIGNEVINVTLGLIKDITTQELQWWQKHDEKRVESINRFLVDLKGQINLWAVVSSDQISEIWDIVRSNEVGFELVMQLTCEVHLKLVSNPSNPDDVHHNWKRLNRALAYAFGAHVSPNRNAEVYIDMDTYQRLPQGKDLEQVLNDNPWLVIVYLLHMVRL